MIEIDYIELCNYVQREFKINLNAYKELQMHRRIESFVSKTNAKTTIDFIRMCTVNDDLREQFLDLITINVTEFFRNPDIFMQLREIFRRHLPKRDCYKIWSSACSNGSEPYSVAMILENMSITNYKILATDIDQNVLNYARNGIYKEDETLGVPDYYLLKYFNKVDDRYQISNSIKNKITFSRHDLLLENFPESLDLILCRNVVIYFKKEEKMKIYNKFYKSLNDNGIVFIGATENIYDHKQIGFTKLGTFFYQKVVK